ncbi:hypothetical protein JYU34_004575 [Plutella xylostella]|uniref:Uncharacterized protein n=1 Tax=Plutella xylostella TaxID=51655 RepID=A0ABQ7QYB8_PLUXY|nr:hypothetical protein JYU34_004575 [Plutella xylostella]
MTLVVGTPFSIIWATFWFLMLILVAFWVALIGGVMYVLIVPYSAFAPDALATCLNFLFKCMQFPLYCTVMMADGKPWDGPS